MITVEEILKELRAGQDLDSIGRNIADMMNDAKEQFDKEEAARIQKEEQKAKQIDTTNLLESFVYYLHRYYPALYEELFPEDNYDVRVLAQDVTAALDLGESIYKDPKVKEAILALGNEDLLGLGPIQKAKKKEPKSYSTSFMDVLSSFLDE